jgi:surface polysaccharide O-acyltransferase-like enzyme
VVFIHNALAIIKMADGVTIGNDAFMPMFYYCSQLFSEVLGRIAVPLFFFISGFLFFLNMNSFNIKSYGNKLRIRMRTLLVPYLFWNILAIVGFYVIVAVPMLNVFVRRELSLEYCLQYLWGVPDAEGKGFMPLSYQFWFIRDLMVVVIFTPVVYFICKWLKLYGIVFIGILWFFGWWFEFFSKAGLSAPAVLFFTCGAYLGICKRNIIDDFSRVKSLALILYPIVAIVDLFTKSYEFNEFIHKAGIIIGIVFCFNLVALLLKTGKINVNKFLTTSAFFVFAIHDPLFLRPLRKVTYVLIKPDADIVVTALYFINVVIVVLTALGLYYLLKRFAPKFTAIITGGR